jgi:hypothetical protein
MDLSLIDDTVQQLRDATVAYRDAVVAAAKARRDYKLAKAKAWVEAFDTKTVTERERRVEIAAVDTEGVWLIAEAQAQAALELVRTLRAELSALQTVVNHSDYPEEV